ncbi:MAG: MBL fold metallo-hydrolase [Lentisphaerae bacterium]|nr:MBL fold metallo-hydrolase [Lentisphaerota bacterium]
MDDEFMTPAAGITALGSGSSGNAYVLHSRCGNYLVDAGFSRKELCRRMQLCNIDPESIRGVLISHEHTDHVKGCRVFCDEFQIPAYISSATADYLYNKKQLPERVVEFISGSDFCLPGVSVTPFSVPHDALDPVGFDFTLDNDCRIAVATDLGCMEKSIACRLYNADILVLEANYDLKMLLESDRKNSLKHRIMGRSGHLDNRTAAECLKELLGPRTRSLLLAHISSECNDRTLLEDLIARQMSELDRSDVVWRLLRQDEPDNGCYAV